MKDKILKDILSYYAKRDISQISHTLKVAYFTRFIAEEENYSKIDTEILEICALLHDIGCPNSKQKYGNTRPCNQEKEGMLVAKEILYQQKYSDQSNEVKERIINAVGSHHQKPKATNQKFMPLFEADAIVNMSEGYFSSPIIARKLIDSKTGLEIFDSIFKEKGI